MAVFPFLRVWVNQETSKMYFEMFIIVFRLLAQWGARIQWEYIHGTGLQAILMDMDTKQLPGIVLRSDPSRTVLTCQ